MAIGRISGPMLLSNLERQGVDLSVETDLLYIDVTNDRIGVSNSSPTVELDVNGDINSNNLVSSTSVTAAGVYLSTNTISTINTDDNLVLSPNGNGLVVIADDDGGSTGIEIGTPTAGSLVSNAVVLTTSSTVTNSIAQLNFILGKLVPPAPPDFPNSTTLTVSYSSVTAKMCDGFTQTDNTSGGGKAVISGSVLTVARSSAYSTNTISNTGPGDSGTITAYLNGASAGSKTFNTAATPSANGTYGNLVISNNRDYHDFDDTINADFWYIFDANLAGTVPAGWNEVQITHSAAGSTNTPYWYYDIENIAAPSLTSVTITPPTIPSLTYSSSIPHYNSTNSFTLGFSVNRLSGDTYPNSSNLTTSTAAGGSFNAPAAISYAAAGITTPLTKNLYVASGSAAATTTASIKSGFGSSAAGPTISISNSYNTGSATFTPSATVLYKTSTTTSIEETSIPIGSSIGTGSGNALRIINPGSGDTPTFSASAAAFNSQSSTLLTYDAVVVGSGSQGVLKHDQTDYSTGYLPVGPDLSSVGRSGTQYFTFKFIRTATSKFDIKFTGTIAGLWVALPGSTIDSASTLNGWLDMSVPYADVGVPGANSGAGGNGSNGCSLGGSVTLNSAVTNHRKTCTFGTESSSNTSTNEIYIRIALSSGQSVTALTLETASN